MIRYTARRLGGVVFCTLAIPSNDEFFSATQTNMSNIFIDGIIACAMFSSLPFDYARFRLNFNQFASGCVRREAIVVETHIFVDALATTIGVFFVVV